MSNFGVAAKNISIRFEEASSNHVIKVSKQTVLTSQTELYSKCRAREVSRSILKMSHASLCAPAPAIITKFPRYLDRLWKEKERRKRERLQQFKKLEYIDRIFWIKLQVKEKIIQQILFIYKNKEQHFWQYAHIYIIQLFRETLCDYIEYNWLLGIIFQ